MHQTQRCLFPVGGFMSQLSSEKAIEKLHGTKVLKEKIRVKRSNQN